MAHWCKLVVQILSSLSLIAKIEALLSFMYTYYSQSPKRHFECPKLVEVIKSKSLNFLKNIKMKWIFMLALSKQMVEKYKPLVVKMSDDAISNVAINTNYELLCDLETIMGLTCVLPMLEAM